MEQNISSPKFNPIKSAIDLSAKIGEIKGKQEMFDKFSPVIKELVEEKQTFQEKLSEHMKDQNEGIAESFQIYEEAGLRREQRAKDFCEGKTVEEFKEFLANQYIPYNSWKDADRDILVKLVLEVYDEEEL
jgi:hypothetical protein